MASFMNQDDGSQSGTAGAFQQGFSAAQNKKKTGKAQNTLKKAQKTGSFQTSQPAATATIPLKPIQSFKKGGRVKKTGLALVHRGEFVVPASKKTSKKTSRKRTTIKP
jgi:hypothetical protein